MKQIAVFEAKTRLSELLTDVQNGEQFTITRHGVAVAQLVAAEAPPSELDRASTQAQQVAQAFQALSALRQGLSLDVPLREAIDHGRD
jgi:prevent-host-death family protein